MNKSDYQCQFCTGDAWNRNIELAGKHSRELAYHWQENNRQHQEILKLRKELLDMKQEAVIEDEAQAERVRAPFVPKVITGGKGPPEPPHGDSPDWLSHLEDHYTFLAQSKKDQTFALGQFSIIYKGTKGILMVISGNKEPIWVDPIRFCRDYRLYEVLQTKEQFELEAKANEVLHEELEEPYVDKQEEETKDEELPF